MRAQFYSPVQALPCKARQSATFGHAAAGEAFADRPMQLPRSPTTLMVTLDLIPTASDVAPAARG